MYLGSAVTEGDATVDSSATKARVSSQSHRFLLSIDGGGVLQGLFITIYPIRYRKPLGTTQISCKAKRPPKRP